MNKKYVYIGKIVNTHGIKGEIKILSDFEKKEKVFIPNMEILIDKTPAIICTYRYHKIFDMITLKDYTNINDVLKFKNKKVYVDREKLNLKDNEYLYEDLIGLEIKENDEIFGKIIDIMYNKNNILLYIEFSKNFYIPLNERYIKKVDLDNKILYVENIKGLII